MNLSRREITLCEIQVKKTTARWISCVQSSWRVKIRHVAAYVSQEVSHDVPRRSTGVRMVNSLIDSRTAPKTVCPEDCAPISFLSTFLSSSVRGSSIRAGYLRQPLCHRVTTATFRAGYLVETRLKVESAGHCLSRNCKKNRRKRFVLQESTVRVQGCECYCQLKGKSRATGIWTQVREKSFFMVLSSPWWSAVVAKVMIENLFHRRFARIQWSLVSRSVHVWRGVLEWWGAFFLVMVSISNLVNLRNKRSPTCHYPVSCNSLEMQNE